MTPSEGESYEANLRGRKADLPKLPYDGISSIFESIGNFYREITAIIVVCGGFLILWRHGGRRQETRRPTRRFKRGGDIHSRDVVGMRWRWRDAVPGE